MFANSLISSPATAVTGNAVLFGDSVCLKPVSNNINNKDCHFPLGNTSVSSIFKKLSHL